MLIDMTEEIAIAERRGDKEYADVLRVEGFTRVEKDEPVYEMSKLARQAIERKLRGTN